MDRGLEAGDLRWIGAESGPQVGIAECQARFNRDSDAGECASDLPGAVVIVAALSEAQREEANNPDEGLHFVS